MTQQEITLNQQWVPATCALPTAEKPLRVAEFDALFAEALQGIERPEQSRLLLDLVFSPQIAAQAAELMTRENHCCSFFTFTLTIADGALTLEVKVPQRQIEVLEGLEKQARAAAKLA